MVKIQKVHVGRQMGNFSFFYAHVFIKSMCHFSHPFFLIFASIAHYICFFVCFFYFNFSSAVRSKIDSTKPYPYSQLLCSNRAELCCNWFGMVEQTATTAQRRGWPIKCIKRSSDVSPSYFNFNMS